MGIWSELREEMRQLEEEAEHDGYWHSVSGTLTILVCGMLCGLRLIGEIADWARAAPPRAFLAQRFGITRAPCRAQFYNILKCVDAEKFGLGLCRWMAGAVGAAQGRTVAIDGKSVRGTGKLTGDGGALHIASAMACELKLVIGSLESAGKGGEQAAFRELLELLDVSGAVVVADALHCSRKSAQATLDAGADYLFSVKGNVPRLREDLELYFREGGAPSSRTAEKNGGRMERRTAYSSGEVGWLRGEGWPGLATIGAIRREAENVKSGEKSDEWSYYISSARLGPEELLARARLEWSVESMHWLLDVHFAEDRTRVWDMNVQKALNTARKIALNMARMFKSARLPQGASLSGVFRACLFDTAKLAEFLDFFSDLRKLD